MIHVSSMDNVVWVLYKLGQEVFVELESKRVRSLQSENALQHVANGSFFVSIVQADKV